MSSSVVIADFCEDLRLQLTQKLAERGVTVPAGLNAERTLHFYLNLELRTLHPQPRRGYWSDTLMGRCLPQSRLAVVKEIVARSEAGADLNPFLSDRLKTKPGYHDRMLNDWGIFHMHLGGTTVGADGFTSRSKELLYVYPQAESLYLLDVLEHGESFGDIQLVEIIHRNWPAIVARHKMGMQPGRALGQSGAEIIKARSYGLQPFVPLTDGTVYMPFGGGLSSCGLNARVVRQTDDLLERARTLQLHYQQNADQLCAELEALTGRRLEQLHLKVILIGADRDLLVVESQLNMGLLRPGQQPPAASYRLVGSPPVGNERAL